MLPEVQLWHYDQRVNDRGIFVDLDLAHGAIDVVAEEKKRLKQVTQEMTGYEELSGEGLESTTSRDKMLAYLLEEYGVPLPDLKKDTLERRIEDPDLPIELRELLSIRLMASTASVSKYHALVRGVSSDGRLRGTMQFGGAQRTMRWAHRMFQPGNMPRPDMKPDEIEQVIALIKERAVSLVYDNVMRCCSNAIRGTIIAPFGRKLVVRDLANIEGRKCAWLAGEDWKLQAFKDYDTILPGQFETKKGKQVPKRKGIDLYIRAYCAAFNVDPRSIDWDSVEGFLCRQIGKVMELMLQYGGGVGAFITGAATYGIDLDAMAKAALPTIPEDVLREAKEFYEWTIKKRRSTFGLTPEVFICCDALKRLWRRAHPAISSYWSELEDAARAAIARPGVWIDARRVSFRRDGPWLKVRLPSGRLLCYPNPMVSEKGEISYMGVNQYSRRWSRIKTYGGKLLENFTQASSRDVMAYAMPDIEEQNYGVILSIHDEFLTETDDTDSYSSNELGEIMTQGFEWSRGLPLASAGFDGYRYRKD